MSEPPLALVESRDGVVVPVTARPRGRHEALIGARGGTLLIETTAAPEAGAANAAIARLLADALAVGRAAVVLKAGGASRHKRFCVAGLPLDVAAARLAAALAETR